MKPANTSLLESYIFKMPRRTVTCLSIVEKNSGNFKLLSKEHLEEILFYVSILEEILFYVWIRYTVNCFLHDWNRWHSWKAIRNKEVYIGSYICILKSGLRYKRGSVRSIRRYFGHFASSCSHFYVAAQLGDEYKGFARARVCFLLHVFSLSIPWTFHNSEVEKDIT